MTEERLPLPTAVNTVRTRLVERTVWDIGTCYRSLEGLAKLGAKNLKITAHGYWWAEGVDQPVYVDNADVRTTSIGPRNVHVLVAPYGSAYKEMWPDRGHGYFIVSGEMSDQPRPG